MNRLIIPVLWYGTPLLLVIFSFIMGRTYQAIVIFVLFILSNVLAGMLFEDDAEVKK
jgi:hypothetical protein